MTYDGARALTVGDYVTPRSGSRAGEVGPWQYAVRAVGIPPRSTAMKVIFVVYGIAWLLFVVAFVRRVPWAPTAMLVAAAGSLWYLPVGTACSVIQIGALVWLRRNG